MAKQNYKYVAEGEINELLLNTFSSDIEICVGDKFCVEFPEGAFTVEDKKGKLFIKRRKKTLPSLNRIKLNISVPLSCVPDVKVALKKCLLEINGGIYGDFSFYGESASVITSDAAFNIILAKGSELHAEYVQTTAKNALIWNVKSGDVLCKNSFFSRMDIDLKSGNIGLWESDFLLCELKVKEGNIQAMLSGAEEDYKLNITVKNGTSNSESGGGGDKSLKCSAAHGNIIIDYNKKKKEINTDADDDVAEDIGGESGT